MSRIPCVAVACILVVGIGTLAQADQILLAPDTGGHQVSWVYHEPIGQSFTAEDPYVFGALYFRPQNPHWPNADDLRYDLYAGAGTGGTHLASRVFTLSDDFEGFFDIDFSQVALTVGSVYSLTVSVLGGNSPYWGIASSCGYQDIEPLTCTYAGGEAIFAGVAGHFHPIDGITVEDMALRVTPIPEPGSLLLLGTGLAGLVAARRRRRQ